MIFNIASFKDLGLCWTFGNSLINRVRLALFSLYYNSSSHPYFGKYIKFPDMLIHVTDLSCSGKHLLHPRNLTHLPANNKFLFSLSCKLLNRFLVQLITNHLSFDLFTFLFSSLSLVLLPVVPKWTWLHHNPLGTSQKYIAQSPSLEKLLKLQFSMYVYRTWFVFLSKNPKRL